MKNHRFFRQKVGSSCLLAAILLLTSAPGIAQEYWEDVAQLPSGRILMSAEAVGGSIYLMGGLISPLQSTTQVYAFNPADNSLQTRTPLPQSLAATATAAVNGKIYLFGGVSYSEGTASKSSYVYDPTTNTWTSLADMSVARGYAVAEAIDQKIYVIGGFASGGAPDLNIVEVYDIASNTWSTAANMPTARGYMCSAVLNDLIYVIGGAEASPSYAALAAVEVYNPANNTWSLATDLPTPRWGLAAGRIDSTIYVIGGVITPSFVDVDVVEGYSEAGWQDFTPMPFAMHGLAIAVFGDSLYTFGGLFGGVTIDDILLFKPGSVGVYNAFEAASVLAQNAPNPFGEYTYIQVDLPLAARVDLQVYDVNGRLIRVLAAGNLSAGQHRFRFDANGLSGGVYFYRIWIDRSYRYTRMMMVEPVAEQ